jgi:type IV secretory pathway TrbD component
MEWWLWAINGLLCFALIFVAIHSLSPIPIIFAALLHWVGNPLLRAAGKHDPHWSTVNHRSLARPLVRPPHGYANDDIRN